MTTPTTLHPGKPNASGYAEPKPNAPGVHDRPHPDAAGGEEAQVTATVPDPDEQAPEDTEPTPPGEHKREPIKDPDPADTKLHVQPGAH